LGTSYLDAAPGTGTFWYWVRDRSYTESGTVDSLESVVGPVIVP
jgi:hypothetical protein